MPRIIQIHPYNPCLPNAGGIGTILRSLAKFAPRDFDMRLVGITHDRGAYPLGQWTRLSIDGVTIRFMPVLEADRHRRGLVPLTLRFLAALWRYRGRIDTAGAILEFHRIEPALAFARGTTQRALFLHCDPAGDLQARTWEARWRFMPWAYLMLESRLIGRMRQVWIVRQQAADAYRRRYAARGVPVDFLPVWIDPTVFGPAPAPRPAGAAPLLLFVGRLAEVKNPLLLLRAFVLLRERLPRATLVMVGAGPLQAQVERFIAAHGLQDAVRLTGALRHADVARWMRAADCLCLSSVTEGMPVVLVEALSCGLPVVSTDVGEAARLVRDPAVGRLVTRHTPDALAAALAETLAQPRDSAACIAHAAPYTAHAVLGELHARYRALHAPLHGAGGHVAGDAAATVLRSVRRSSDSNGRSTKR